MRFQFCGNVNCPEWFIAEISVLTKITAVKMKLIFSQIILHFLDNTDITTKVSKLLNGTGLDIYQMHSVIATLKFILQNSVTFNVNDLTLNKQLIDLGLPKQNVESITKTYKSSRDKLVEKSLEKVLKTTSDIQLSYSIHELLASSRTGTHSSDEGNMKNLNIGKAVFAQIQLGYKDCILSERKKQDFIVSSQQLNYLIFQIENGLETIEKLQKTENNRNQQPQLQ